MSTLKFHLFGKLNVQQGAQSVLNLEGRKAQELLCYLLVHRDRPHPRETLATLLWGDNSTERSRKYLRQALWHLHSTFAAVLPVAKQFLSIDHDWVQLNLNGECWVDVTAFERASAETEDMPASKLTADRVETLKQAVELYRGDLLDGWYSDWCLFERERLQNIYLTMLDKLLSHCVDHDEYEAGFGYGSTILRYDRASERTYRQLMTLKYSSGDRTGALRLYRRCVAALEEELGVAPESQTTAVYEQIRKGASNQVLENDSAGDATSLPEVLNRLKRLQSILGSVQRRLQRDIAVVEHSFKSMK